MARGSFPSNSRLNSKEQVKAITLRSENEVRMKKV